MQKLYWYEWGNKAKIESRRLAQCKTMGGLGLNFSKIKVSHSSTGIYHDLARDTGFFAQEPGEDYAANRLVTVRRIGEYENININTETFITSGIDLQELFVHYPDKFKEQIKDISVMNTTPEGEEAVAWNIQPALVVPFYNKELDENFTQWEMFEEAGFIYGLDKRTGEIYELKHYMAEIGVPMTNQVVVREMFVISNDTGEYEEGFGLTFSDILSMLPNGGQLTALHADWIVELNGQAVDFKIKQINGSRRHSESTFVARYIKI